MKDLDPREGEGKKLADELEAVYYKAFDKFAGPAKFRHSANYPTYHRAALLGIYKHLKKI